MFTQLMPLIEKRPLTLTVAAISSTQIRVNVVPQPTDKDKKANAAIGHSHAKEVAAIPDEALQGLTTPLCLTGTPEEIDAQLVTALSGFTALHAGLQQSFDEAAATIKQACTAIDERERIKKEKDKGKSAASSKTSDGKKDDEKKPAEEAALPLLFTTQAQAPVAVSAGDPSQRNATDAAGQLNEQA
ncbi:MAG TPA: PRTRC system protein E [Candidatus Angelobacter sp.]|nr:PRTRC system protein E [Candidatus Angelobacter sp.]